MAGLDRKRIIFLNLTFELGGAERQSFLLARYVKERRGALPEMWALRTPGPLAEMCAEAGIPWRIQPCAWDGSRHLTRQEKVVALLRFAIAVRQARPDALLPYTSLPNIIGGLTWRLGGAGTMIWNQRDDGKWRPSERAMRLAARLTPLFVANSQGGAAFLRQELGVAENRLHHVQNGLWPDEPKSGRAEWRSRLGLPADAFVAVMVANLSRSKDHATLLRAWKIIMQRHDARQHPVLCLAGRKYDTFPVLETLCRELGISQSVRMPGFVDDIPGLLGACDIAVFSSRREGLPNGVLEAMAAGLPVVATDIPGIREAVGEDGLPYLAPPGDETRLAQLILSLRSAPELMSRLGRQGRERVCREFGIERLGERMAGLIEYGGRRG